MVGLSVKTESIFYPSLTGCLRFLWKSQNMGPWDEIYWHWPLYPKILGVNKTVLLMNTLPQIPESPFHLNNNLTWQWIDFPPTLERSLELSRRNHRNSGGPPVSSSSGLSLIDKGWARREELRAFESFLRETISRGYHLSFPGDVQCAGPVRGLDWSESHWQEVSRQASSLRAIDVTTLRGPLPLTTGLSPLLAGESTVRYVQESIHQG